MLTFFPEPDRRNAIGYMKEVKSFNTKPYGDLLSLKNFTNAKKVFKITRQKYAFSDFFFLINIHSN